MSTPQSSAGFSLRFRLLMSYHDLTLKDIAERTGNAVSTVGTWKNGRIPASARTLVALAEIFGVSPEYLLEGRVGKGRKSEPQQTFEQLWQALKEGGSGDLELNEEPAGYHYKTRMSDDSGPREAAARRKELIEAYLREYLDRVGEDADILTHAWVQLRRDFPLQTPSR